ncbi:hypothetical protein BGX26_007803, partial [Mortierella sp. AD094]
MTLDDTRSHLADIRDPAFDPRNYSRKGYVLSGSFRTNGFTLQLSAYKLKELQAVRFRRLPDSMLPPRLTSTVGGTTYYLQEIRNVAKTKDDVARLWPHCPPEMIKILCLDAGQAFIVAGSAFLPVADSPSNDKKGKGIVTVTSTVLGITPSSTSMAASGANSAAPSTDVPYPDTFYNMSVNQKAVYQPTFKFRGWTEERKREVPEGATQSIEEIESDLPPLRGPDANVEQYIQHLEAVEQLLHDFYNGSNRLYQSHAWDAQRALEEEISMIANSLLKMVGGSSGVKRDEKNMVVIGIGLGQFSSSSRLTTLHNTFLSFFVPL